MTTPQGYSKVFDKDIKGKVRKTTIGVALERLKAMNVITTAALGYIFTIDGHSTKMRFPKDDRVDLCIV